MFHIAASVATSPPAEEMTAPVVLRRAEPIRPIRYGFFSAFRH